MTSGHQPHVFVSHCSTDQEFCRIFVTALQDYGYDVWYDEQHLGLQLRSMVEEEMEQREHFIALLSPAAITSDQVNDEIDGALELWMEGKLRTFLLVIVAPCTIPLLLRHYTYITSLDGRAVNVNEATDRVIAAITSSMHFTTESFPERLLNLGYELTEMGNAQVIIPPVCDVPAGEFMLGSDPLIDGDAAPEEQEQHPIGLSSFQIMRFPVTVAEFGFFVRTGQRPPTDWEYQLRRLDHPVVNVSWHDAVAYATWLAKLTGDLWRLPNEAEWEKAARWDAATQDAHIFPWGDFFDSSQCNTEKSEIGSTTPVGSYPNGASPCGAQDMVGNVLEWTGSLYLPYPLDFRDESISFFVGPTTSRVLRGGSWGNAWQFARAASRRSGPPSASGDNVGFRLVIQTENHGSFQVMKRDAPSFIYCYRNHSKEVITVAWAPDGKRIASADTHTLRVWEPHTGKELYHCSTSGGDKGPGDFVSLSWSPDSTRFVSGALHPQSVKIWDAKSGRCLLVYSGHSGWVMAVAWSPNGEYIASGGRDKTVQVWDTTNGSCVNTFTAHTDYVQSVAWSPDSKYIASGGFDNTVQIWEALTGKIVCRHIDHSKRVLSVAWSPDGKFIASGSADRTVQVWDAYTGKSICSYLEHGNWKRYTYRQYTSTHLWQRLNSDESAGRVYSLAWSPDGKQIVSSAAEDRMVHVWNSGTGATIFTYRGHASPTNKYAHGVNAVAWSPLGYIASGGDDKTVQVWTWE